ncbi:MFS transporter [Paractinoplanes brasiliensis]|uniref:Putative MFS family arabinose efflux permease n=1 Tax=Paractinoplanes brasiliensis TaxID=52695 RepID=A0A4R6K4A2_9ACTN|nr:MFS transporter [Actinoplanes brasiliensis]TDO42095.1 putative MFS family arabinose efflux permease [Actinoplanes brasiliensis]GID33030.1 MFS transporter [Actinoplanes brasiliensis]
MSFQRSRAAVAALFFTLGFQYSTWAARLPALTDRLGMSAAQVGVLLLAAGVGALISFPLVARLLTRYGSRRLAVAAALVLVAALAGLAAAPSFPVAVAVVLVDGVAVGCLNVAMNAQGAALEAAFERTTMAKLHALFSGGIFSAALLASAVTAVTGSVAAHFAVAGALLIALVLTARPALLTHDLPAAGSTTGGGRFRLPAAVTVSVGLAMLLATVTEGAMTDWSALYLREVTHAEEYLLPLGIAVTSAAMVIGRLFADGWRDRWGDKPVLLAGAALAGLGLAVALLVGGVVPALAGFACVGFGMAPVSPCLYVAAARQGPAALTVAAAMGTAGLLIGPPAIGFVAEGAGLVWGMAAVVATAWLAALCVLPVRFSPSGRPQPSATPPEATEPAGNAPTR